MALGIQQIINPFLARFAGLARQGSIKQELLKSDKKEELGIFAKFVNSNDSVKDFYFDVLPDKHCKVFYDNFNILIDRIAIDATELNLGRFSKKDVLGLFDLEIQTMYHHNSDVKTHKICLVSKDAYRGLGTYELASYGVRDRTTWVDAGGCQYSRNIYPPQYSNLKLLNSQGSLTQVRIAEKTNGIAR